MSVAGGAGAAPSATIAAGAALAAPAAGGLTGNPAVNLVSGELRGLGTADLMRAFLIALLLQGSDDDRQRGSSPLDLLAGLAVLGALGGAQGACGFSLEYAGGGAAAAYAAPAATVAAGTQA
jgi:hypothetical protein